MTAPVHISTHLVVAPEHGAHPEIPRQPLEAKNGAIVGEADDCGCPQPPPRMKVSVPDIGEVTVK